MSLCINPNCQKPENADNQLFCQSCGSELLLAGRYRVTKLLSDKGGFGRTYQVEDLHDNNKVKVLKVLILNVAKAVQLFKQEAAVLQKLQHPGIPKGYESIEFFPKNSQDPLHCLVMQYIEGQDLEEYVNNLGRPIDQKSALEWLKEIAEILQAVHGANFFHRDIKPSNIMFQPNGKLALIDFGTAREMTGTYVAKQNIGAITKISSAGFTPPEQENNRAVPQSDFFALGRTFLYLLTGKLPTDSEIYDAYNDELKWRGFAKGISPLLADLIDELMVRQASQRPQSPEVILQRLAEIERQLYPPPKPPLKPQSPKPKTQTISATAAYSSLLQTWRPSFLSFEVVKVDDRGNIVKRENRQAQYFIEDLGNGVTLDMVSIPGGTFMMGSPESEKERRDDEGPQHR
jgi:serine/threonine protein kinase